MGPGVVRSRCGEDGDAACVSGGRDPLMLAAGTVTQAVAVGVNLRA